MDGIYRDQLDALLKQVSPDFRGILPDSNPSTPKKKLVLTDEQKVFDKLHGTYQDPNPYTPRPRPKKIPQRKVPSFNFDGTPIPPVTSKSWGKTIISVRRPDGTFETRKTERNGDGSVITTITKTGADGRQVTQTFNSDSKAIKPLPAATTTEMETGRYDPEKNLRDCDGYKVPVLW